MRHWIKLLALLGCGAGFVHAEETTSYQDTTYTDAGASVGISATRQKYETGDDGEGRQVYFSPYFIYDQWMFSAYISAERTKGQYLSETQYPQLSQICALQQSGSRFNFVNDALSEACDDTVTTETEEEEKTGLNDILLFVSYDFILPDPNTGLSVGLSYSHDNGDYETGHGSGTRDLYADVTGRLYVESVTFWGSLGYTRIISNETPFQLENYGSGSVGVNWRAQDWLSLNSSFNVQQSSVENGDGYHYISAGLSLGKAEGWGGNLNLYKYEDNPGLPEREIQAGLFYNF